MTPTQILFSFKGRLNRQRFWQYYFLLFIPHGLFMLSIYAITEAGYFPPAWYVTTYMIPFTLVIFALTIKRLHDLGKSGWWLFLNAIPVLGTVWLLFEVCFTRGTSGPNKYGPAPLETHLYK